MDDSKSRASATDQQFVVLQILCVFELGLIGLTWPLWTGTSNFPKVPLLKIVQTVPPQLDHLLLLLLLVSLVVTTVTSGQRGRWSTLFCVVCVIDVIAGLGLVFINVHRLQAWHWFTLEYLIAFVVLKNQKSLLATMQLLIATLYVCSALSRMAPGLEFSMTGQIVTVLLKITKQQFWAMDIAAIQRISWMFAAAELLIGLGLLFPRTQRTCAILAIVLHGTLMLALGPVGLNHHRGVFVWNGCFVLTLPLLFGLVRGKSWPVVHRDPISVIRQGSWLTQGIAVAAIAFPLSGLLGLADNWPGWQLYSSRPETWKLYVQPSQVDRLPVSVQSCVGRPDPFQGFLPVRLDRWSLQETGAPIYPEDRFQLAVIEQLVLARLEQNAYYVEVEEPEIFPWWRRRARVLRDINGLWKERGRFWLNSRASSETPVVTGGPPTK